MSRPPSPLTSAKLTRGSPRSTSGRASPAISTGGQQPRGPTPAVPAPGSWSQPSHRAPLCTRMSLRPSPSRSSSRSTRVVEAVGRRAPPSHGRSERRRERIGARRGGCRGADRVQGVGAGEPLRHHEQVRGAVAVGVGERDARRVQPHRTGQGPGDVRPGEDAAAGVAPPTGGGTAQIEQVRQAVAIEVDELRTALAHRERQPGQDLQARVSGPGVVEADRRARQGAAVLGVRRLRDGCQKAAPGPAVVVVAEVPGTEQARGEVGPVQLDDGDPGADAQQHPEAAVGEGVRALLVTESDQVAAPAHGGQAEVAAAAFPGVGHCVAGAVGDRVQQPGHGGPGAVGEPGLRAAAEHVHGVLQVDQLPARFRAPEDPLSKAVDLGRPAGVDPRLQRADSVEGRVCGAARLWAPRRRVIRGRFSDQPRPSQSEPEPEW